MNKKIILLIICSILNLKVQAGGYDPNNSGDSSSVEYSDKSNIIYSNKINNGEAEFTLNAKINGICSSANGKTYPKEGDSGVLDMINLVSSSGCEKGVVTNLYSKKILFGKTYVNWTCLGEYGGSSSNCSIIVKESFDYGCLTSGCIRQGSSN